MSPTEIIICIIEGAISIVLFYVAAKAAKIDKLEDRIERKAEEVIKARFELIQVSVAGSIQLANQVTEQIRERLSQGDAQFEEDRQALHKLELGTRTRIDDQRNWVTENFTLKEDFEKLRDSMTRLQLGYARLQQHMGIRASVGEDI